MGATDSRAGEYYFSAVVASTTIGPLTERAHRLAASGRRMAVVKRYLHDRTSAEVHAGLTLDSQRTNPIDRFNDQQSGVGIQVHLAPGIRGWGFNDTGLYSTERAALAVLESEAPKNVTKVTIEGFGESPEDKIEILHYNQHGVGRHTTVVFDPGPTRRERAEYDAALLDLLAERAPQPIDLAALARELRDSWHTLAEHLPASAPDRASSPTSSRPERPSPLGSPEA